MRRRVAVVILACACSLPVGVTLFGCTGLGGSGTGAAPTGADDTLRPGPPVSEASSPEATAPPAPERPSGGPVTARWPPGLAAAVLGFTDGFVVVDRDGVIFTERRPQLESPGPGTSATIRGPVELDLRPGVYGHSLSVDRYLIASGFPGEELVLRSTLTGRMERSMWVPVGAANQILAVSDGGRFVALRLMETVIASDTDRPLPWTITIVDLVRGTHTVPAALRELSSGRPFEGGDGPPALTGAWFLPGGRLLVGMADRGTQRTVLYDLASDSLSPFPLDYVQAGSGSVSTDGVVVGLRYGPEPPPGARSGANPAARSTDLWVWRDGVLEPVIPDPGWPVAGPGAVSPGGTMLVLRVDESADYSPRAEDHAMQPFRRVGGEWRSSGPATRIQWSNQIALGCVGTDDRTFWSGFAQQIGDRTVHHVVSLDTSSGEWGDWFTLDDLRVAPPGLREGGFWIFAIPE